MNVPFDVPKEVAVSQDKKNFLLNYMAHTKL